MKALGIKTQVKFGGEQAGVDKANLSIHVSSQCESFRSLILQVPA